MNNGYCPNGHAAIVTELLTDPLGYSYEMECPICIKIWRIKTLSDGSVLLDLVQIPVNDDNKPIWLDQYLQDDGYDDHLK